MITINTEQIKKRLIEEYKKLDEKRVFNSWLKKHKLHNLFYRDHNQRMRNLTYIKLRELWLSNEDIYLINK